MADAYSTLRARWQALEVLNEDAIAIAVAYMQLGAEQQQLVDEKIELLQRGVPIEEALRD